MNDPTDHFRLAIAAAGLAAPDMIHGDGAIHRFATAGRRGDVSGWYLLHTDGIPAGTFGCWRAGLHSTWCAKSDNAMTPAEREAHRQRIQVMRAQRDAAELARLREEADKATARWNVATTHCHHPYLAHKGVRAHGIKQDGDVLLIPLRDPAGVLHSLQTIDADGDKRYRGRKKGCYHAIGKPLGRIIVCEGYATGASIHEATGEAVAVAFDAGNLMAVATALHKAYPELVLLLAADDDHRTEGNPGLSSARDAALTVGGFVVVPQFPPDRPAKATDFNDLAALAGLGAVRACFAEILEFAC
jgi:putative DNA primase/helicase